MRHLRLLSAVFLLHISGYVCVEIIGGKEAAPHSRPYMVFLRNNQNTQRKNENLVCGGALIKANWVITAAHCEIVNATKVVVGAHKRDDNANQQIGIKRAIRHPCFDWDTKINDLQLVQLEKPVKISKFVSTLPLPKQEVNVKPKTFCNTAGWGLTNSNKASDVLREVNLTIVDNNSCNKAYSKSKKKETITSSMICAGPLKKHKEDTCTGDSGGPLICNNEFTGIVSFGPIKCGDIKFPGVYTRLTSKYLTWIRDTTGGATF